MIFKFRDVFSAIAVAACCVLLYIWAAGLEWDRKRGHQKGPRGLIPPQYDNEVELCTHQLTQVDQNPMHKM